MFLSFAIVLTGAVHAQQGVIEVTAENFDAVVTQATKPVIIDFHATWCGPCKTVKPLFAELAQEHTDWVFAAIDIDQAPDIAATCNVTAVPTFVVFKQGVQWGSVEGGRKKAQLMEDVQQIVTRATPEVAYIPSAEVQALMAEIAKGDLVAVKQMLSDGVDINGYIKSPIGNMTPLMIAVSTTQEMIDLLLKSGARVDDDFKRIVKLQCEMYQNVQEKLQQSLAHARAVVQARKSVKPTYKLTGDVVAQQLFAALKDVVELKRLIDAGMDVNQVASLGAMEATPLLLALFSDNQAVVDLLIAAGASLETQVLDHTGVKKSVAAVVRDTIDMYENLCNTMHANLEYIVKRK